MVVSINRGFPPLKGRGRNKISPALFTKEGEKKNPPLSPFYKGGRKGDFKRKEKDRGKRGIKT